MSIPPRRKKTLGLPRATKGRGIQLSKKIITETIHEDHDKHGYYWTVVDLSNKATHRYPQLEVWWEGPQRMCVRQENGDTADVISLSLGQCYDLMRVVARALDCGPAD